MKGEGGHFERSELEVLESELGILHTEYGRLKHRASVHASSDVLSPEQRQEMDAQAEGKLQEMVKATAAALRRLPREQKAQVPKLVERVVTQDKGALRGAGRLFGTSRLLEFWENVAVEAATGQEEKAP